jgi:hypothetical protein
MNKNKTSSQPSVFKKILFFLIVSLFSISSSYGDGKISLLKKENIDFIYHVQQVTWSMDIKNAVVDIVLVIDAEDQGKAKMPFLFFRFCNKPDDLWFYGQRGYDYPEGALANPHTLRWKKYQVGEEPLSYLFNGRDNFPQKNNIPYYVMSTGKPVDISSMRSIVGGNCGEILAGYGLGATRQEAYDEMLSQKRFGVKFSTEFGLNKIDYTFEVKVVKTYRRPPPIIFLGLCTVGLVKGCS